MTISNLQELRDLYSSFEVRTIYLKHLAPKQDNDKNQIYLGGGLDGVTNLCPALINARSPSESWQKRKSQSGKPKLEAKIDLAWISAKRNLSAARDLHPAPNTRIIDYFQYPEVRMSGFLSGCTAAPDPLRRRLQSRYGQRILALGVTRSGQVLGYVLTERDDPIVGNFPDLPQLRAAPIFRVLVVGDTTGSSPLELLLAEIRNIATGGWYSSRILRKASGISEPFRGNQGAGYTLEALLGVGANAKKAPDKYGFEIKSYRGSRISLMTPTPDGGFQGDHSFREFMERYGRPGQKGDGSIRFTGLFRCGIENKKTQMILTVEGYDPVTGKFASAVENISVRLTHRPTDAIVASWSLTHLANAWNAKHSSAAYVPSSKKTSPPSSRYDAEYSYGPAIIVGQGTDVWRLLRAIHAGAIYYDPADSIYANGKAKVRPQWRINTRNLKQALEPLYSSVEEIPL